MTEILASIEPAVEQIRPILAGKPPEVQSAILAMCLAMWVNGMQVLGDLEETKELQAYALGRHIQLVTDLIESGAVKPVSGRN